MKVYLSLILFFVANTVWANMASPYFYGTASAQAFASQKVKVLNENLHILIDSNFQTARITAEYEIEMDSVGEGKFIPLLFLAERFQGEFQAWVNGQPVEWKPVPPEYILDDLSPPFEANKTIKIAWDNPRYPSTHNFDDLKYFEAPIYKKQQTVKVSYVAFMSKNNRDWIKRYKLAYAWSPARYWETFGNLKLTIEKQGEPADINVNINQQPTVKTANVVEYQLDKLPTADLLLIEYKPSVSNFTHLLIYVHPLGIMWIMFAFCLIAQLFYQYWDKKRLLPLVSSWSLWGKYALTSALILITPILAYAWVDYLLGDAANGRVDYNLYFTLALFAFPFMWFVYGITQFFTAQLLWALFVKK